MLFFYDCRLAKLRKELGISQSDLARAVGCSKNAISSIERNEYIASLPLFCALIDFLCCDVDDFYNIVVYTGGHVYAFSFKYGVLTECDSSYKRLLNDVTFSELSCNSRYIDFLKSVYSC